MIETGLGVGGRTRPEASVGAMVDADFGNVDPSHAVWSVLTALVTALDAQGNALFLADQAARVVWRTRAAESQLQGRVLTLEDGRLGASAPGQTSRLRQAIRHPGGASLRLDSCEAALELRIVRVGTDAYCPLRLVRCQDVLGAWPLTTSEKAVAECLRLGMSLPEIAKQRRRALSTVKSQAKAIYAKTDTKGQLDFVVKSRPSHF